MCFGEHDCRFLPEIIEKLYRKSDVPSPLEGANILNTLCSLDYQCKSLGS
jgi:hypothetical protein